MVKLLLIMKLLTLKKENLYYTADYGRKINL
nr:MAG TPA: hypothetical protein [Caudoviricetes sp.]